MKDGLEEFLKRIEAKPSNETLIDRFMTLVLEVEGLDRILYLKKLVGLLLNSNPYAALKAAYVELQEARKEKLSNEYEIGALKDVESCFLKLERKDNAALIREEIKKLQVSSSQEARVPPKVSPEPKPSRASSEAKAPQTSPEPKPTAISLDSEPIIAEPRARQQTQITLLEDIDSFESETVNKDPLADEVLYRPADKREPAEPTFSLKDSRLLTQEPIPVEAIRAKDFQTAVTQAKVLSNEGAANFDWPGPDEAAGAKAEEDDFNLEYTKQSMRSLELEKAKSPIEQFSVQELDEEAEFDSDAGNYIAKDSYSELALPLAGNAEEPAFASSLSEEDEEVEKDEEDEDDEPKPFSLVEDDEPAVMPNEQTSIISLEAIEEAKRQVAIIHKSPAPDYEFSTADEVRNAQRNPFQELSSIDEEDESKLYFAPEEPDQDDVPEQARSPNHMSAPPDEEPSLSSIAPRPQMKAVIESPFSLRQEEDWRLLQERLRMLSGVQLGKEHLADFIRGLLNVDSNNPEVKRVMSLLLSFSEGKISSALKRRVAEWLFEDVEPRALHELLRSLKLEEAAVRLYTSYLRILMEESQHRRALNVMHDVLSDGLDLDWYRQSFKLLPELWQRLGMEGWLWTEEEGATVFCKRLMSREEPRLLSLLA